MFINLSNNKFNVHVLKGTTGSGKTIVYFEALKKILIKGNKFDATQLSKFINNKSEENQFKNLKINPEDFLDLFYLVFLLDHLLKNQIEKFLRRKKQLCKQKFLRQA